MAARYRGSRLAASVVLATASILVSLTVDLAAAATTCSFDDASHVITATLDAATPHTFDRSGSSIRLDGSACQDATVTSTDTVDITAADGATMTFDLSGGPFAPGATDEGDGSSEIEFIVSPATGPETGVHVAVEGTGGADHIVAGQHDVPGQPFDDSLDLNADEAVIDADVYGLPGAFADVTLAGIDGDDEVLGYFPRDGGSYPAFMPVTIDAGAGDDTMGWWAHGGALDGGPGRDLLDESLVGDRLDIFLIDGRIATAGFEVPALNVEDVIGGVDRDWIIAGPGGGMLDGAAGDDQIFGSEATDMIDGGAGRDQVFGLGGDDVLIGGGDPFDEVEFSDSAAPVAVDLRAGTAMGEGNDTLEGFQEVVGTRFADTLYGTSGSDILFGGDGADDLHGRGGPDEISGNGGDDHLVGGHGKDYLFGGWSDDGLDGGRLRDHCDGGHGKGDTAVRCEDEVGLPRHSSQLR
jgi:Ca2+-binding RTX toxin-like protein